MKNKDVLFLNACKENNFEEVKKLVLESDVDINSYTKRSKTGLQIACENNNTEMAIFLINHGIEVDTVDDFDFSPLTEAANNNLELVKLILEKKPKNFVLEFKSHCYDTTQTVNWDVDKEIILLLRRAEAEVEYERSIEDPKEEITKKEKKCDRAEEFVEFGFTTEFKYNSDKKTYTYKTTYH
jgi:ankyrin repeat protein